MIGAIVNAPEVICQKKEIVGMILIETDRLIIRNLRELDSADYYDMMGNFNVMRLIPREVMTREESDKHLKNLIDTDQVVSEKNVFGIEIRGKDEFIGICAFLKNNEKEDEIGCRLREKFWSQGYGTEVTKGLISYGFEELKMEKITADVDARNLNSIHTLRKFMNPTKEFFNEKDNCMDRRFELLKIDWLQQNM